MKKTKQKKTERRSPARSVCVICGKEKEGSRVSDDMVIKAIRVVKRKLGLAKENRLVVCKDDLPEHERRRKKFEKNMVAYSAIAFVLVVAVVFLSGSISGALVALLIGAFVVFLGLVGNYHPAIAKPGARHA